MTKKLDFEGLMPYMEELFKLGKTVKIQAKGISMRPFLHEGRDYVILSKVDDATKLKKYQTPLYKREDGTYVLHRIVGIKNGAYNMCGDNQTEIEKGVLPSQIKAVAVSFIRNGKEVSENALLYKLYARTWHYLWPIRPIIKTLNRSLRGKNK